jgi:hypothetical protein
MTFPFAFATSLLLGAVYVFVTVWTGWGPSDMGGQATFTDSSAWIYVGKGIAAYAAFMLVVTGLQSMLATPPEQSARVTRLTELAGRLGLILIGLAALVVVGFVLLMIFAFMGG